MSFLINLIKKSAEFNNVSENVMNASIRPVESYKDAGSYCIYKSGVSRSAVLYIHYFLSIGKGFCIFLFRDCIYNIYNLSLKLTYLLLISYYKTKLTYLLPTSNTRWHGGPVQ